MLIDNLADKIKIYKNFNDSLDQAIYMKNKLLSELDNLQEVAELDWFSDEDALIVEKKYADNKLEIEYLREAVSVALYGIKYAAYRLGRTRSRTRPEP